MKSGSITSPDIEILPQSEVVGKSIHHPKPRDFLLSLPARKRQKAHSRQALYAVMVRELNQKYRISVRKWRHQMSGAAYELHYSHGGIKRIILAPKPRGCVSAAIYLHEVGHHAIGFGRYKLRCLEEYYVWQWAFREMRHREISIDHRVLRHYKQSMCHYVRQARREGIKDFPALLHPFVRHAN